MEQRTGFEFVGFMAVLLTGGVAAGKVFRLSGDPEFVARIGRYSEGLAEHITLLTTVSGFVLMLSVIILVFFLKSPFRQNQGESNALINIGLVLVGIGLFWGLSTFFFLAYQALAFSFL